ncbi:MAG: twin-arginine translocation signal domain-containing protein [Acidobacteriia bacterium]|nr:twin-arginine translocation signal domain-containing protein [Terriglobia bacterium]
MSMKKPKKISVDRRDFLRNATVGAAALVASPLAGNAQETPQAQASAESRNATAPLAPPASRTPEAAAIANLDLQIVERPGSDFMVDVIKSLGFEYMCANPGNTFRSLHESLINYGGNQSPEFITCCHEESAVAMGHGYAKIEGKPLLVCVHGTVGLQHAAMAIYDAYCDRVPVVLMLGNFGDAAARFGFVDWVHSAQDPAATIRDFVKWDDQPVSLTHFAESTVRAYKIAMTPPTMPVALVADHELQERPIPEWPDPAVPKLTMTSPPAGDPDAVAEAARLLVAAENPVLVLDRSARTPAGLALTIELAETLQAAVIDRNNRMNFPTRHPLNQTERGGAAIAGADVIAGLELTDFWGTVHRVRGQVYRSGEVVTKPGTKLLSITANDLYMKSNYQEVQRYQPLDLAIAADAEATLPSLLEAVKRQLTDDRKRTFADRGAKLARVHEQAMQQAREAAASGWDASPISTARMSAELWAQLKDEDWSLVSNCQFVNRWPLRLWNFDKHYQYIGGEGAYGVGYGAPASIGAALGNRKHGRLTVSIQNDGDMMFAPGVLWTAAHHRIPILIMMHNNRAYHQEVMEVQRMASQHNRGITRGPIGSTLTDPPIDYSKLAASMGIFGQGPISDPKDLAPAIRRAIEVVKRGEPALVDVLTQPR